MKELRPAQMLIETAIFNKFFIAQILFKTDLRKLNLDNFLPWKYLRKPIR